jgi:hypothetical protein
MVKVYAIVLAVGVLGLVAWIFVSYLAGNAESFNRLDPERRWGRGGRRLLAGMVGFGMAGLSSEFSPRNISWPIALGIAVAGAGAAVWYAGWVDRPSESAAPSTHTGDR